MPPTNDWITSAITEAETKRPLLTKTVLIRMKELLTGQLREQQLSKKELTTLAKDLIASMITVPPESKQ